MDLYLLGPTLKKEKLIEGWSSLIWSERYSPNGDFELVSHDIPGIMSQLPLDNGTDNDTLVCIGDSNVPMVVETHKIDKPKNGSPTITTSGRTFETVLDRRQTIDSFSKTLAVTTMSVSHTSLAMAVYTIAAEVVNFGKPGWTGFLPQVNLINSIYDNAEETLYEVEPKELYAWMIETLDKNKYALRSELGPSETQIAVLIYKGEDRSTEVVFDVSLDQFDEASYILSKAGSKNAMITNTANGSDLYGPDFVLGSMKNRIGYQDISQEITLDAGPDLNSVMANRGAVELAKHLPIALFSGGLAEGLSTGYGSEYFLGDTVTLQGEYGLSQKARVAEFIRVHDEKGFRAYPTFEGVDD